MKKIIVIISLVLLSGCGAGTNFKWSSVRQVKVGMTEQQVRDLMDDKPFRISTDSATGIEKWEYIYSNRFTGTRNASFAFKDGKVISSPKVPDSFE